MACQHVNKPHQLIVTVLVIVRLTTSVASGVVMEQTREAHMTGTSEYNGPQGLLVPFQKMATFFLESIVQSPSLADLNKTEDLGTFESLLTSAEIHWQNWLRHYWSYVICLSVAAVYILALPIAGCTIAACRSRDRCIIRPLKRTGRRSRARRRLCTGLLLVTCVALLVGVIGMFIADKQVHEWTRPDGLPALLRLKVDRFNNYLQQAQTEYSDYERQLASTLSVLKTSVRDFPEDVQDQVGNETKLGPFLRNLTDCLARLNQTEIILTQLDDIVSNVNAKIDSLSARLIELKEDPAMNLSTCNRSECQQLVGMISSLRIEANFSDVGSVTSDDLIKYLHGDDRIDEHVAACNDKYNKVGQSVAEVSAPSLAALIDKDEAVLDEVNSILNRTLQKLDDARISSRLVDFIDEKLSPTLRTYGDVAYNVGLALSCLVLLVVVLCHVGLAYGACGTADEESTECCKKVRAHPALKASIVVVFLVAPVIMLAVSVLFPVGAIAHNDFCRNMRVPPPDPRAAAVIDKMFTSALDLPIGLLDLQQACVGGQTAYSVFSRLEAGQDLTEKLTVDSFNISVEVDRLKSATYLNSTLNATSDQLEKILFNLTSLMKTLNFTSYEQQLTNSLTSEAFVLYPNNLSLVEMEYANRLNAVYVEQYLPALEAVTALNDSIANVKRLTVDLDTVQELLDEAKQNPLTPESVNAAATVVADRILNSYVSFFRDVIGSIQAGVASCDVVGSLIGDSRDALCQQLVGPYNSFWFSAAWCLAFFVVLIPTVLILTDIIRTTIPDNKPLVRASSLASIERLNIEKWVAAAGGHPKDEGRCISCDQSPATAAARPSPASSSKDKHRPHQESRDARNDHRPAPRHLIRSTSNQPHLPRQDTTPYHRSKSYEPRRTTQPDFNRAISHDVLHRSRDQYYNRMSSDGYGWMTNSAHHDGGYPANRYHGYVLDW